MASNETHQALRLRITGFVQGVGYRDSIRRRAQALGATGWVRNRADGSVEAVIVGTTAVCEKLIEWARRGPPAARVDDVEIRLANEVESDGVDASFDFRPTA